MAENKEDLKSLLMRVKEESEKTGLKLRSWHLVPYIFMANRWGNNGNCDRCYLWRWGGGAPKSLWMVTAALKLKDACSLEEVTNLDRILKSRDITLPTKFRIVKPMVFPVVM